MNINDINYKAKRSFVMATCEMYRKIKGIEKSDDLPKGYFEKYRSQVSHFEYILSQLTYMERQIIEHDFIRRVDSDWFDKYCSKATYYKHKHKAIDEFVKLFYK